jgi:glutamyl-tRNA reductase
MQIVVVGMNHKSAPIEIREKIAFKPGQDADFLESLNSEKSVSEAVVLSTCNRTEVYAILDKKLAPEWLEDKLFEFHGLDGNVPREHIRIRKRDDVIRHLFHVSCSLDSLVLGESQILSQVKMAYSLAKEKNTAGPVFNFLFQRCFKTAKQVYTTTGIARNKVSISSLAVDLAQQKLGDLSDKTVLIIGSGKVGRLSADHFTGKGIRRIFILDLGVPRNVDPEIATLPGVFLYNIDQLEEIALSHMTARHESAEKASALVRHEAEKAIDQLEAAKRKEVVSDIVAKFEAIREAEVSRSLNKMGKLAGKQTTELEHLTKRIISKILHQPFSKLKPPILLEDRQNNLEALENLFS